jgi:hypothetical protein
MLVKYPALKPFNVPRMELRLYEFRKEFRPFLFHTFIVILKDLRVRRQPKIIFTG